MDTLPQSASNQSSTPPIPASTSKPIGGMAKELDVTRIPSAETNPGDATHETSLSPEVAHAGVRMQSDAIELPKTVTQLGVTMVTQTPTTPAVVPTVTLPLSDEQIAQGLHQSITSSIRWLAEWCERRLKEIHFVVRAIGGKAVREKA